MTNENEDPRAPFENIGGSDAGASSPPPPPPATQAPSAPTPPVNPAPPPPAVTPPPPAASSANTAPSSFNTVSGGPTAATGGAVGQPFQQAPYEPPEPKSKIGLVIGAILLFFLVLAGGVVAVVALARGGDDDTVVAEEPEIEVAEEESEPVDGEVDSDEGTEVQEAEVEDETSAEPEDDSDVPLGTVTDPVAEDFADLAVADGAVEEVSGELSPNGFDTYSIEVEEGNVIEVTVQAVGDGGLDTLLRAVDSNGRQVAFNDDAPPEAGLPGLFDSQLFYVADSTGTHIIEVLGFDGETSGEYLLTVNRTGEALTFADLAEGGDGDGAVPAERGEFEIEDDVILTTGPNVVEVIDASIESFNGLDIYELELEAGEQVRVAVEADPESLFDPVLTVFDIDLNSVGFNDDAETITTIDGNTDSELEFVAPESDSYLLNIVSFGEEVGAYTLTIERSEGSDADPEVPELADLPSSLFLESGDSVTVSGNVGLDDAFDLILERGDELIVTVNADDPVVLGSIDQGDQLDPIARLEFGGWVVDLNDDAVDETAVNSSFDSQLILNTAHTGIHTIVVEGFGGTTGAFEMIVERN